MAYRSEEDPEYKRLQIEDPKLAITCPQCTGAGEILQGNQEYSTCPGCGGIGKVIPITDKQGRATFRRAYFITGPKLHGPKDAKLLEQRRKRPRAHLPLVDDEGRTCVSISYVPVMPGSMEEERLGRAVDMLVKLGRAAKGETNAANPVPSVGRRLAKPAPRKRQRRGNDEDE